MNELSDRELCDAFIVHCFSYYKLERSGDALPNSYWLIPWSGEQSHKAVGLLGPGPTGGPKVHGTNAPMKCRGAQRGQWPRNNGFASFFFVQITCQRYLAVASAFVVKVRVVRDFGRFLRSKKELHIITEAYKNTS